MEHASRFAGSRVEAVTRSGVLLFAVVALAYGAGYELASNWFSAEDQGASFFPAAGVTLAALVLVPRRRWGWVLAGAAAAELTLDITGGIEVLASIGYALANTAEPFVGAMLLLAFAPRADLRRSADLAAFLGCAVVAAPIVGGAIAATNFVLVDGNSGWARFAFEWWSGDGLGVLVVGSAILSLRAAPAVPSRRWIEAAVTASLAVAATAVVFELGWFEFVYVPVALLVVLAFRVGTTAVAITSALTAFVAAGATAEAQDFWASIDVSPANRILYLQLGLAVVISAVLALAAEISERERIAVELARSESERAAAVERLALYESERAARERAQLLERNAGHLAAAATEQEVASSTVQDLAGAGIPIVGVEALRDDGERRFVSILAVTGLPAGVVAAFEDYPLETHTPGAEAIRTGLPVEIGSGAEYDARFPGTAQVRRESDTQSVLAVPMRSAGGEIIGAVSGAAAESGWFDDSRRALVTAVAEQTGLALERASLLERERRARARAELDERLAVQLQHVTAALAAAETQGDVARAVVTELIPTLGGMGGSLFVVDEDAAQLRMVDHASYPEDVIDAYREMPLSRRTPPSDAVRAAEPILFPDVDAFRAAYPEVVEDVGLDDPRYGRAWAHVPLFVGTRPVGMLIMAYAEPQPFDRRQRETLVSICDAVAQALRRTELYEAEREARLRAELLQSHAGGLAAAATTHDVARTTIAGLEAAGISSAWVQLVRGGKLEMLETAGVPDENLVRYRSYGIEEETPPAEAARTGAVVEVAGGGELDARFPAAAAGRRANPFESLVSVPLVTASGRILGVLTFTSRQPGWLDENRRLLALGLAEQCGLALERAQLRGEAEEAAADAALLAHLGEVLERATGVSERAGALVRALVGDRSALAVVHSRAETGGLRILAEASTGPALDAERGRYETLAAAALVEDGPTADESGDVHLHAVPLRARNRALGVLTIGVRAEDASPLTTVMAQRVATRAALAFDNALLYEQERDVSHSLQLGLLGGALEEAPDTVAATAYRPGTATLEVGGDWYDQFTLPDGRLALVVGDVVGHGLEAAVAMGQLRGAVRALAPSGSPREVLEQLDRLVDTLPEAAMATLAYALLDTGTGALTYACAGHPPPLVVPAEGAPRLLWDGRSAPLGSSFGGRRAEAVDELRPGDTIVLYTDGLVERRTDGVSAGLERLVTCVDGRGDAQPGELVSTILDACLADTRQEDDVCVLAVRLVPAARFERAFRASPVEVADMRRALAAWLEGVDLDPRGRRDAVLAVAEAAANAAEHAYGFDGAGVVRVEARVANGDLTVSVLDQGTWREPAESPDRGRGRTMMEALTAEVAIDSGERGTVVRMRMPTRTAAPA